MILNEEDLLLRHAVNDHKLNAERAVNVIQLYMKPKKLL